MPSTIVKIFNQELNFWESNPAILSIKLFKDLHDKDKSKGKVNSSKIMWAIALLVDPNEYNAWRNINEEDKKILIKEDYLKQKDFKWSDYQELITEYEERCLTIAERELIRLERKLVDRANFIANTKYTVDEWDEESGKIKKGTADQLDKMLINTSKIYEELERIKTMINRDKNQGTVRGKASKSASEEGLI